MRIDTVPNEEPDDSGFTLAFAGKMAFPVGEFILVVVVVADDFLYAGVIAQQGDRALRWLLRSRLRLLLC